jgi:hypothetical protein
MSEYFNIQTVGGRFAQADSLIDIMDTKLLANGWTRYDSLNTGSFANWDVVYRSTGAANDARIYIRINRQDATDPKIVFRAYSWWDTSGSTGYNETGAASTTFWTSSTSPMLLGRVFGLVDEYECTMFVEDDSGVYVYWSFGQANRTDVVGEHRNFFAVGVQERSSGSHVNILIDRSIEGHYRFHRTTPAPSMLVHIISQSAASGGGALYSSDPMTEYSEIPLSGIYQITFEPLSIDVKIGYLYGLNAMPVYVSAAASDSALVGYFIFDGTHTRTGSLSQQAALYPFIRDSVADFDASAFNHLIHGSRLAFYSSNGNAFLGVLRHLSVLTARGGIGKKTRFLTGPADPDDAYIFPFGDVLKWTSGELDWVPMLGPGAERD